MPIRLQRPEEHEIPWWGFLSVVMLILVTIVVTVLIWQLVV